MCQFIGRRMSDISAISRDVSAVMKGASRGQNRPDRLARPQAECRELESSSDRHGGCAPEKLDRDGCIRGAGGYRGLKFRRRSD